MVETLLDKDKNRLCWAGVNKSTDLKILSFIGTQNAWWHFREFTLFKVEIEYEMPFEELSIFLFLSYCLFDLGFRCMAFFSSYPPGSKWWNPPVEFLLRRILSYIWSLDCLGMYINHSDWQLESFKNHLLTHSFLYSWRRKFDRHYRNGVTIRIWVGP